LQAEVLRAVVERQAEMTRIGLDGAGREGPQAAWADGEGATPM